MITTRRNRLAVFVLAPILALVAAGCGSSATAPPATSQPTKAVVVITNVPTATQTTRTVIVVVTGTPKPTATPNVKATSVARRGARARATATAKLGVQKRATATAKLRLNTQATVTVKQHARGTATVVVERKATATAARQTQAQATSTARQGAIVRATALSNQRAAAHATSVAASSAHTQATAAARRQAVAQTTAVARHHAHARATAVARRRVHSAAAHATAVAERHVRATATAIARRRAVPPTVRPKPSPVPTARPRPTPKPTRTPAPSPTATNRVAGPKLGAVTHSQAEIRQLQAGSTTAALAYYLNPIRVVANRLALYGYTAPFQIVPKVTVVVIYSGKRYDVVLARPIKPGVGGAWFITRIARHGARSLTATPLPKPAAPVPGQPQLGMVTHTLTDLRRIQAAVDANNPQLVYYRNPIQVVVRNLSQHGFTGPLQIVPRIVVEVFYQQKLYDVVLRQPATRGPTGIWVVSDIHPHRP